jgi:ATP-dependent RNA helicase DeaD
MLEKVKYYLYTCLQYKFRNKSRVIDNILIFIYKCVKMTTFEEFNLKQELEEALNKMNFTTPTEVQEKAIPLALAGKDIVVKSKTGTGKTGAFLVPIIQFLTAKDKMAATIVVPTRELAIQVFNVLQKLTAGSKLRGTLVYGGASINVQIDSLRRQPNIVVGTPGRIIDLMERGELKFNQTKILVLDEADMMLDLGFMEDVEYIMSVMPKEKQVMLFSATIPERIAKMSKKYMENPQYLNISQDKELTVNSISHKYAMSKRSAKLETLFTYISEFKPKKSIIFSDTKRNADYLYNALVRKGYKATVMHGDLRQAQREKALQEFRRTAQFLVATNVAARGLDITGISDIINYDTPSEPYVYVHRVGRSARMGADGSAFSIVSPDEMTLIREIEHSVKIRMKCIELDSQISQEVSLEMADFKPRRSESRDTDSHRRFDRGRRGGNSGYGRNSYSGRSYGGHRSNSSERPYPGE